ncbi:MAG: Wzz/FepE/Etk N-terminal domain-containing protein [Candidatus Acetothermia bacterium]|jgi:uncharacterized protein involved in exopolysaccharide biosynthesis|nr:Wzz/FepE/Etk N-terminal domain-containing protein [Candidatus Acetothermia bacterium]MDH7505983.1 Wzz/FepE/Etk N-terminal domain-containing protein [Candidatus Acetothermia bacterium]
MEEYEVDLRDCFRVMWRKKWIIVATFFVALIAAALASWWTPSRYQADGLYQLRGIAAASGTVLSAPSSETAVAMLSSRELLQEASEGLIAAGGSSSLELKVTSRKDNLVEMELRGARSPELLAQVLAKVVQLFSTRVKDQTRADMQERLLRMQQRAALLEAEQAQLAQQIQELLSREGVAQAKVGEFDATLEGVALRLELSDLYARLGPIRKELDTLRLSEQELSELLATDWEPLAVMNAPSGSPAPIGPNRTMNLAVAGVLGLFVGILLAFFVNYMQGGKRPEAG